MRDVEIQSVICLAVAYLLVPKPSLEKAAAFVVILQIMAMQIFSFWGGEANAEGHLKQIHF